MDKIKKNLPVILLSCCLTLLLVIVILLIHNNNVFSFTNSSKSNDTNKENIKEIKKEEKENKKEEESIPIEKNDIKENTPSVNTNTTTDTDDSIDIVSYIENEEKLFENKSSDEGVLSKLKTSFVSIIDFIFYEKEIKGYTFKELTNTAKLKVISLALKIDNQIDKYFPDYKEKIKDKYTSIKGKLALKYLEITTSFCEKDPATCTQAKEDFNNMKQSFGLTFSLLKELAKSGTSKVKDLYENWRDE